MTTIVPADLTQFLRAAKALPEHPAMTEAISLAEDMLANPSRQNQQSLLALGYQNTMKANRYAEIAIYHAVCGETNKTLPQISKTAAHASAATLAYMASTLEIPG